MVLEGLYLERLLLRLCETPMLDHGSAGVKYPVQSPEVDRERKI